MADDFNNNLVRLLGSCAYTLVSLELSRHMFDKSYFALGANEKIVVDQATANLITGNFQMLTPEVLKSAMAQPASATTAGFQPKASGSSPTAEKPDKGS